MIQFENLLNLGILEINLPNNFSHLGIFTILSLDLHSCIHLTCDLLLHVFKNQPHAIGCLRIWYQIIVIFLIQFYVPFKTISAHMRRANE